MKIIEVTPTDRKQIDTIIADLKKVGWKPYIYKGSYDEIRDIKWKSKISSQSIYGQNDSVSRAFRDKNSPYLYKTIILLNADYLMYDKIRELTEKLKELNPKRYFKKSWIDDFL